MSPTGFWKRMIFQVMVLMKEIMKIKIKKKKGLVETVYVIKASTSKVLSFFYH